MGAALSALEHDGIPTVPWADVMPTLALADPKRRGSTLAPLAVEPSPAAPFDPLPTDGPVDAYLGVDVGSVSTNLVLLSPDGKVYEGIYLPTRGRPIEAIGQGLDIIRDRIGEQAARARRRGHGERPPSRCALAGRGPGQERDYLPAARRGRDRAGCRHDLRDRRPGLEIHPRPRRAHRRLRDEQDLRGRHRVVPGGAGGPLGRCDRGRVFASRGGVDRTLRPRLPVHGVHAQRSRRRAASRDLHAGPLRRAGVLGCPQLPRPCRLRTTHRPFDHVPGRGREQSVRRRRVPADPRDTRPRPPLRQGLGSHRRGAARARSSADHNLLPRPRRLPRPGGEVLRVPGLREPLPGESDSRSSGTRSTSATPANGTRAASSVMPPERRARPRRSLAGNRAALPGASARAPRTHRHPTRLHAA